MTSEEQFKKTISRFTTGFALSQAILEDYANIVAKIEGVDQEVVKERITKRADEIIRNIKQEAGEALKG